jgi:hypothetical protein
MKKIRLAILIGLIGLTGFGNPALAFRQQHLPHLSQMDSLRYNHMEDEWSYQSDEDRLRYNPMDDHWSYEEPDNYLRYNPMEDRWEYAQ